MSFTLEQAARLYGVPLVDYERRGTGLCIASGAGTMMATMDAVPALRWCFDIDAMPDHGPLEGFCQMAAELASPVVVVGWFSITDPEPLRAAIAQMSRPPLVYAGDRSLGVGIECHSLRELFERCAPP